LVPAGASKNSWPTKKATGPAPCYNWYRSAGRITGVNWFALSGFTAIKVIAERVYRISVYAEDIDDESVN